MAGGRLSIRPTNDSAQKAVEKLAVVDVDVPRAWRDA